MMNKWLYWFHLLAASWWSTGGVALALIFPKSVLYVSLMSAWANLIAHAAAWGAARTEKRQMAQQKET
jgi:hypothetical protein